ncbi:hypothetical protein DRO57_02985 [Candidatus Bathyarchaeota archaeon]|nr:MAG: hypothetical protein DRO57_02985 [Candidatus Bathyarchaeota archaeon]
MFLTERYVFGISARDLHRGGSLKRLRNWLLFSIVVLIWSSNWSVMKMGLSYVDPWSFIYHRFLLSTTALSLLLFILKRRIPADKRGLVRLFILGLITSIGITSTSLGLVYEKSGVSAILTYTQPLFVFCMAIPFLGEKMNIGRALGVLIGFLGVMILSTRGDSFIDSLDFPVFLLVAGAFLWATAIIYYKKFLSHIDPTVANTFQLGVGVVLLTPVIALKGLAFPLHWITLPSSYTLRFVPKAWR